MSNAPVNPSNPAQEMMKQIEPVVSSFVTFIDGKITRDEALKLFYSFMLKTLPPPLKVQKELATSLVKAPLTGFANIPQLMAAMVVLLEE
jgi:hypothetical protein